MDPVTFKETKDRVKYLCRNSNFKEAQAVLDEFFTTTFDQLDQNEQSKALLRQVLVAYKAWDLRRLGNFFD